MVPTLTILGRFSEATRGAVIPWLETTLVTVVIMAVLDPKVTSIPRFLYSDFTKLPATNKETNEIRQQ